MGCLTVGRHRWSLVGAWANWSGWDVFVSNWSPLELPGQLCSRTCEKLQAITVCNLVCNYHWYRIEFWACAEMRDRWTKRWHGLPGIYGLFTLPYIPGNPCYNNYLLLKIIVLLMITSLFVAIAKTLIKWLCCRMMVCLYLQPLSNYSDHTRQPLSCCKLFGWQRQHGPSEFSISLSFLNYGFFLVGKFFPPTRYVRGVVNARWEC